MALNAAPGSFGIAMNLALQSDNQTQTKGTVNQNFSIPITFGTTLAADQVSKVYQKLITVNLSSATSFDLTDLTLEDFEGTGLNFTKIKAIAITCISEVATVDWTMSGNFMTGNSLTGGTYHERSGFCSIDMRNGWTVTGTSQDVVTLTNNSAVNTDFVVTFAGI